MSLLVFDRREAGRQGWSAARTRGDGSTVLTSNKGFEDWGAIFELMATALIDRLVHHCHIVNILGNS